jgi:hypothetical protein
MPSNAYIATDGETVLKVGKSNDVKRREKQIAVPIKCTIACLDETAAYRVETQLRDFVIKRGGLQHQGTIDWFKFDQQIYAMLLEFATGLNGQILVEGGGSPLQGTSVPKSTLDLPTNEDNLDAEIEVLRTRYYALITAEAAKERDEALEQVRWLESQIDISIQRQKELHEQYEQAQKRLEQEYKERERNLAAEYEQREHASNADYQKSGISLREKYENLLREAGRLEGIIEVMRAQQGNQTDNASAI